MLLCLPGQLLQNNVLEEDHGLFSEVTEVYGAGLPLHCNDLFPCGRGGVGVGGKGGV